MQALPHPPGSSSRYGPGYPWIIVQMLTLHAAMCRPLDSHPGLRFITVQLEFVQLGKRPSMHGGGAVKQE